MTDLSTVCSLACTHRSITLITPHHYHSMASSRGCCGVSVFSFQLLNTAVRGSGDGAICPGLTSNDVRTCSITFLWIQPMLSSLQRGTIRSTKTDSFLLLACCCIGTPLVLCILSIYLHAFQSRISWHCITTISPMCNSANKNKCECIANKSPIEEKFPKYQFQCNIPA